MDSPTTSAIDTQDPADVRRGLLIPVGHDWHVVALESVREVVADPMVTALPTASALILGVFNLRGEIVPLFDTARLVGTGSLASWAFVVVVETTRGRGGLATTGAPETVDLGHPLGSTETEGLTLSYAVGTRVGTLMDLEVLLDPAHLAR